MALRVVYHQTHQPLFFVQLYFTYPIRGFSSLNFVEVRTDLERNSFNKKERERFSQERLVREVVKSLITASSLDILQKTSLKNTAVKKPFQTNPREELPIISLSS